MNTTNPSKKRLLINSLKFTLYQKNYYLSNMKLLVLISCIVFLSSVFSQEIEHAHSIHHAFIENKGQWDSKVLFKSRFKGGNLWVEQGKMMFHLQDYSDYQKAHAQPGSSKPVNTFTQHIVNLNFVGSNKIEQITKAIPTSNYYNFFIGNDPSKWTSDVRGYSEATLHNLYKGIDLKLIEDQEQLKYEFHVAANTDPSLIQLHFTGQKNIAVDKSGNLIVYTPLGNIQEKKPYAYQIINGKIKKVECTFDVKGENVNFKLGNYDKNTSLVIDPILVFATYSGSITDNFGMTATYGYDETAYSGGTIYGNSYPTPDPAAYDTDSHFSVPNVTNSVTTDIFISKYSSNGTTMLWTTFFGGGDDLIGTETVHSLICDKSNNLYLFGATSSTDIPIQNGYQSVHSGGQALSVSYNGTNFDAAGIDIFVAKFSANGHNLLGSTYVGGSGNDGVNYNTFGGNYPTAGRYDSLTINYGDQFRGEIMLDTAGNCIIASCTRSNDFPTVNPIQAANAGMQDGVIFKLNNDLSTMLFSTYIGGSNNDACYSVKVDSAYNIVFAGGTSSLNLPTTPGVWKETYCGGKVDGFIGKMDAAGNNIEVLSYVGTSNLDQVFFVEIDRSNNIFALGQSRGGLFPVTNAGYSNPNSGQFIAKFSSDMSTIQNSTVFGNGNTQLNISPSAFLVDFCGNIYVSGWGANILQNTPLNGMSVTPDAFQPNSPNGFDFYLMVLNRTFNTLLYGSYLGGNRAQEHVDGGTSRFDKNGVVYQSVCGGCGGFSDFPTTTGAWSNINRSTNCNNLLFKFDFQITPKAQFSTDIVSGCAPLKITFNNTSTASDTYLWDFGDGHLDSTTFNPTFTYNIPGTYTTYLYVTDSICQITDTAMVTINVFDSLLVDVPDKIQLCKPIEITLTGNSFGLADQFRWSSSNQFTDMLNASPADSTLTITPSGSTVYYFRVSNAFCTKYDSVIVEFISSAISLSGDNKICKGERTLITVTNSNPSVNFTYVWSPVSVIVNQPSSNTVNVSPPTSQYIYITASTAGGCIVKDSIFINVSDLGSINVEATASETSVLQGTTVTLYGQPPGYSYSWTPTMGLSTPANQQTQATINQTTTFTFSVSDQFCTKSDTVLVKTVPFVCDNPFIFVPNAFSPNGDGDNDILYVRSRIIQEVVFRVFDRWGEMVFESTSMSNGWDGIFKGRKCDPDVYDYYLKVICIDGQENIIKGNVTLLK